MLAAQAVRLELASALQLADNSTTAISWTTQPVATNSSMHSTTTDLSHVLPQSTGVFLCHVSLTWNVANSTVYQITIEDSSGAVVAYGSWLNGSTTIATGPTFTASGIKYIDTLAAAPWVRVVVKAVGSTSRLDVTAGRTQFSVMKLR